MQLQNRIFLSLGLALLVSVSVTIGLDAIVDWARFPQAEKIVVTPGGPYSVAGKPSISADHINQILEAQRSPFAGRGQLIYDLGLQYGIDPVYALAFWKHESNFGTAGWAKVTLNPGNIRGSGRGGWTYFKNWDDGIEAWYRLIQRYATGAINFTNPQGFGCTPPKPCRLIEQIIPVYAPSTDGNNVNAYISAVTNSVDTWQANSKAKGSSKAAPKPLSPAPSSPAKPAPTKPAPPTGDTGGEKAQKRRVAKPHKGEQS